MPDPSAIERLKAHRRAQAAGASSTGPAGGKPSPLIERLGGASRLTTTITRCSWPGDDSAEVDIRLLSDDDIAEAEIAAALYLKSKKIPPDHPLHDKEFSYARQAAILARALIDPETQEPVFSSIGECRPLLTREEADLLGKRWADHQEAMAPLANNLSTEDMLGYWEAVKKTRSETLLLSLPPSTLRALLLTLASQPEASTGPSSSSSTNDGAPPSGS
jgi:hypothetical protein